MLTNSTHLINRKIIILQRGFSQRKLAEAVGCSPAAITFVMTGKTRRRAMHDKIAAVLGVPVAELWPEFYDAVNEKKVSHDSKLNEINESVN